MKTPSSFICVSALAATTINTNLVDARPMHAGIDYHRYLQEKDDIQTELDEWMSEFKDEAKKNGWLPSSISEARSADDAEEDQRQRFFMTKESIKKLEQENPDAVFSTKSPFTLLTDEEFNTYVGNAYRKGDADRRLRSADWFDDLFTQAPAASTDAASSSNSRSATAYDFDFSSFFDWISTRVPATKAPTTRAPVTRAPVTTAPITSAPTATAPATEAPVAGDADIPVTPAPVTPVPTTKAPATPTPATTAPVTRVPATTAPIRTRAPATSTPGRGPVAPVDSDLPPASTTTAPPVASDGDSLDWSTGPCVSPVQNQGQCGSCWAFASIAAIESGQCIANGKTGLTKYSEQQLTSCDTSNLGCNGGAPTLAYKYIQTNGLCTAAAYPYASSGGSRGSCQSSCAKVQTGLKGSTRVQGEAGLVAAVQKKPVVVAVAAGNNAWKQYAGGVLSTCQTSQVDHAVVAVGYDASTIKIRNSWGARWGEAGYIRLKRGGAATGTCSLYTDMSSPTF